MNAEPTKRANEALTLAAKALRNEAAAHRNRADWLDHQATAFEAMAHANYEPVFFQGHAQTTSTLPDIKGRARTAPLVTDIQEVEDGIKELARDAIRADLGAGRSEAA